VRAASRSTKRQNQEEEKMSELYDDPKMTDARRNIIWAERLLENLADQLEDASSRVEAALESLRECDPNWDPRTGRYRTEEIHKEMTDESWRYRRQEIQWMMNNQGDENESGPPQRGA
jgi:hypothetical protein